MKFPGGTPKPGKPGKPPKPGGKPGGKPGLGGKEPFVVTEQLAEVVGV